MISKINCTSVRFRGSSLFKQMMLGILLSSTALTACKKIYNVPAGSDYLSESINYTVDTYRPVLGRTTVFGSFSSDDSTFPLKFEIVNPRNNAGTATTAFSQTSSALVWNGRYTGLEKSIAEIEAKRSVEERPLFEVATSGEFILWAGARNNNFLKPVSDSAYVFDVRVSNNGGSRLIRKINIIPRRERPYEPSFHIDEVTGLSKLEPNGAVKRLIPAILAGMRASTLQRNLEREIRDDQKKTLTQDCWVYFKKKAGEGHSLTFKFMDKDSLPINPAKFNNTKWDQLVHGFNMEMTPQYVKYDIAYPVPLIKAPTVYTTIDGAQANVVFSYSRIGFSGSREIGTMSLAFNIFEKGDWEIIFFFHNDTPKFENE
ncbi:DUF5007 domain-containing protein [Pedobacter hiemivivus]|uniref:DUF5007 domain-containing protein n=1 Tax=Pedobacter hiemivivus TaxID=2530454 RepID=A0A4R0NKL1_9SPHI|nr:DUF5007 domain-containing protein [Pedobacter hiemivivus]TCC99494.1 DUF5007 domain-containing protein [Pedobacter hiemivivus]